MTRRSHQTIEVLIRFPLPAGKKAPEALEFLKDSLRDYPLFNQLTFKIVKRETHYL